MFKNISAKFKGGEHVSRRYLRFYHKLLSEIRRCDDEFASATQEQLIKYAQVCVSPILYNNLDRSISANKIYPATLKARSTLRLFSIVKAMVKQTLGFEVYDEQMIGAFALFEGRIIEMNTGEGKTLVAAVAATVRGLLKFNVHIVTTNEYLACRDVAIMKPLYNAFGLSVSSLRKDMDIEDRKSTYGCAIIYTTASELGFDFLRNNTASCTNNQVANPFQFTIIDEVDSVLIDDARTPLILSQSVQSEASTISLFADVVSQFSTVVRPDIRYTTPDDVFDADLILYLKQKQAALTEAGYTHFENILLERKLILSREDLYSERAIGLIQGIQMAAQARWLYIRDVDYVIEHNEIIIINPNTGRKDIGRRWSNGLHQAIEANERLTIRPSSRCIASITIQSLFSMYGILSGMSGTVHSEQREFASLFGLDVISIPPHRPNIRLDYNDVVFSTKSAKFAQLTKDIQAFHLNKRPVLVGTQSIQESEELSRCLELAGIAHTVLNAKNHEREAAIVAHAGDAGAVTISTNMAGRGTDIKLGGTDAASTASVASLGGLHVIGTSRALSRRIDDQLRGRAGRQGDPGSSQFYISLEDEIFTVFSKSSMISFMKTLVDHSDGNGIQTDLVSRAIRDIQQICMDQQYETRKHLVRFDRIIDIQRKEIYALRQAVLFKTECSMVKDQNNETREFVAQLFERAIARFLPEFLDGSVLTDDSILQLENYLTIRFGIVCPLQNTFETSASPDTTKIRSCIFAHLVQHFDNLMGQLADFYTVDPSIPPQSVVSHFVGGVFLKVLDELWQDENAVLLSIKDNIHLSSYAHRDPWCEFNQRAFAEFAALLSQLELTVTESLFEHAHMNIQVLKGIEVKTIDKSKFLTDSSLSRD